MRIRAYRTLLAAGLLAPAAAPAAAPKVSVAAPLSSAAAPLASAYRAALVAPSPVHTGVALAEALAVRHGRAPAAAAARDGITVAARSIAVPTAPGGLREEDWSTFFDAARASNPEEFRARRLGDGSVLVRLPKGVPEKLAVGQRALKDELSRLFPRQPRSETSVLLPPLPAFRAATAARGFELVTPGQLGHYGLVDSLLPFFAKGQFPLLQWHDLPVHWAKLTRAPVDEYADAAAVAFALAESPLGRAEPKLTARVRAEIEGVLHYLASVKDIGHAHEGRPVAERVADRLLNELNGRPGGLSLLLRKDPALAARLSAWLAPRGALGRSLSSRIEAALRSERAAASGWARFFELNPPAFGEPGFRGDGAVELAVGAAEAAELKPLLARVFPELRQPEGPGRIALPRAERFKAATKEASGFELAFPKAGDGADAGPILGWTARRRWPMFERGDLLRAWPRLMAGLDSGAVGEIAATGLRFAQSPAARGERGRETGYHFRRLLEDAIRGASGRDLQAELAADPRVAAAFSRLDAGERAAARDWFASQGRFGRLLAEAL